MLIWNYAIDADGCATLITEGLDGILDVFSAEMVVSVTTTPRARFDIEWTANFTITCVTVVRSIFFECFWCWMCWNDLILFYLRPLEDACILTEDARIARKRLLWSHVIDFVNFFSEIFILCLDERLDIISHCWNAFSVWCFAKFWIDWIILTSIRSLNIYLYSIALLILHRWVQICKPTATCWTINFNHLSLRMDRLFFHTTHLLPLKLIINCRVGRFFQVDWVGVAQRTWWISKFNGICSGWICCFWRWRLFLQHVLISICLWIRCLRVVFFSAVHCILIIWPCWWYQFLIDLRWAVESGLGMEEPLQYLSLQSCADMLQDVWFCTHTCAATTSLITILNLLGILLNVRLD